MALGEERFLLCQIFESTSGSRYFLLPCPIAEAAQGRRGMLTAAVIARWVLPQWFFQRYEGTPGSGLVVGALVDEYGRELTAAQVGALRLGARDLDEDTHPALSYGAALHEMEPGWDVLVLPHDSGAGASLINRPPLVGKHILWVDDHPSNNQFEIGYLERLGASISYATTTEHAMNELIKHKPDLVVSDIVRNENGRRVVLAGYDLFHQMRARIVVDAAMTPMLFYTSDRRQAPAEIRELTADRRSALFTLIGAQLGVRI